MTGETVANSLSERIGQVRIVTSIAKDVGSAEAPTFRAGASADRRAEATNPWATRNSPSKVEAIAGEVHVDGLEQEIVCFTPNAARLTADSLLRGAAQAEQQRAQAVSDKVASSAAVQQGIRTASNRRWEIIMSAIRGHVVKTPAKKQPYKVVLAHEGRADTEQPVATVRDGEALIRQETPTPPQRDATYDRPAPDA